MMRTKLSTGGAPGAPGGVHDMPPKKTYLRILNEEEALLIPEIDKTEALNNIRALKKSLEPKTDQEITNE